MAFAYKCVLSHSLESGSILSAGGEVVFPTGDQDKGFGKGITVFEPFVAFGQILPHSNFLHFQGGFELFFPPLFGYVWGYLQQSPRQQCLYVTDRRHVAEFRQIRIVTYAVNPNRGIPSDGMKVQSELKPNRARCCSQSMGKERISLASDRPTGSSPMRIASTMSGARVVNFRMRPT